MNHFLSFEDVGMITGGEAVTIKAIVPDYTKTLDRIVIPRKEGKDFLVTCLVIGEARPFWNVRLPAIYFDHEHERAPFDPIPVVSGMTIELTVCNISGDCAYCLPMAIVS